MSVSLILNDLSHFSNPWCAQVVRSLQPSSVKVSQSLGKHYGGSLQIIESQKFCHSQSESYWPGCPCFPRHVGNTPSWPRNLGISRWKLPTSNISTTGRWSEERFTIWMVNCGWLQNKWLHGSYGECTQGALQFVHNFDLSNYAVWYQIDWSGDRPKIINVH